MRRASALLVSLIVLALVGLLSLALLNNVADWRTRYRNQQPYQELRVQRAWSEWQSRHP